MAKNGTWVFQQVELVHPTYMDVSENNDTPKIIHFNRVFH